MTDDLTGINAEVSVAVGALFQTGAFTLASGARSAFKVECDSLTPAGWDALAGVAAGRLPPFGRVEGVPRGGVPFAGALAKYATPDCRTILVADDVWTTGGTMRRFVAGRDFPAGVVGVVAFARGPVPAWVTAVWVSGDVCARASEAAKDDSAMGYG